MTQLYREAVLTSRRLMESSSRFSARDELLHRASKPKSALEGQVADRYVTQASLNRRFVDPPDPVKS